MQTYLLYCGYAGSSLEVKTETESEDAMEIKTEADSAYFDMKVWSRMLAVNVQNATLQQVNWYVICCYTHTTRQGRINHSGTPYQRKVGPIAWDIAG